MVRQTGSERRRREIRILDLVELSLQAASRGDGYVRDARRSKGIDRQLLQDSTWRIRSCHASTACLSDDPAVNPQVFLPKGWTASL